MNEALYRKARRHLKDALATLNRYDKAERIEWALSDIEAARKVLKQAQDGQRNSPQ